MQSHMDTHSAESETHSNTYTAWSFLGASSLSHHNSRGNIHALQLRGKTHKQHVLSIAGCLLYFSFQWISYYINATMILQGLSQFYFQQILKSAIVGYTCLSNWQVRVLCPLLSERQGNRGSNSLWQRCKGVMIGVLLFWKTVGCLCFPDSLHYFTCIFRFTESNDCLSNNQMKKREKQKALAHTGSCKITDINRHVHEIPDKL